MVSGLGAPTVPPPDSDDDAELDDETRQLLIDLSNSGNRGAMDRITHIEHPAAPGGWLPVVRPGQFVHPRSETAHILRVVDRREGTSHSLRLISYGPVELFLRKLLTWCRWRRPPSR